METLNTFKHLSKNFTTLGTASKEKLFLETTK